MYDFNLELQKNASTMALSTARLRAVDLSRLVAHLRVFRLFMKGKFDAYILLNNTDQY